MKVNANSIINLKLSAEVVKVLGVGISIIIPSEILSVTAAEGVFDHFSEIHENGTVKIVASRRDGGEVSGTHEIATIQIKTGTESFQIDGVQGTFVNPDSIEIPVEDISTLIEISVESSCRFFFEVEIV